MEKRFEEGELFGILPDDVTRWMMLKLYGTNDEGGTNVEGPLRIRSSTLDRGICRIGCRIGIKKM